MICGTFLNALELRNIPQIIGALILRFKVYCLIKVLGSLGRSIVLDRERMLGIVGLGFRV